MPCMHLMDSDKPQKQKQHQIQDGHSGNRTAALFCTGRFSILCRTVGPNAGFLELFPQSLQDLQTKSFCSWCCFVNGLSHPPKFLMVSHPAARGKEKQRRLISSTSPFMPLRALCMMSVTWLCFPRMCNQWRYKKLLAVFFGSRVRMKQLKEGRTSRSCSGLFPLLGSSWLFC